MKRRALGSTGLELSVLGFGCGSIGGLLVRGDYPAMRRTVARAAELGINYFDTAPLYGDGQSEVNLGAVLRELGTDVLVGTKVRLGPTDLDRIEDAIIEEVEGSLRRLGRERIDLIQLHNPLTRHARAGWAPVSASHLMPAMRAFQALAGQGKVRCWGITALGETEALHQALAAGGFHTIQAAYNMLNPSAGCRVPPAFPFQDYRRLIDRAAASRTGVIAIRVLAGGALSGIADRHPIAAPSVNPIASEPEYAADVARAQRFAFLAREGIVDNLVEAAIRFAISKAEISTALVGLSSLEQLEWAARCADRGPLPAEVLARLEAGHEGLA
jgi:aryl-alcohol dehydrogenase-like predicted oxidoreductase